MFQDDALDFVIYALREESYRRQLAILLPKGDLDGLYQLTASLGFACTPYHITLALELRILRLMRKERISERELMQLFGARDWRTVVHTWQAYYQMLEA